MSVSKLAKRFKMDESKEEEGVWADFGDEIRVKIRRFSSRISRETRKQLEKPYQDVIRRGPLPDHVAEDLLDKQIAYAIIADWEIPEETEVKNEDGTTKTVKAFLPATKENKLRIVKEFREFRDEIFAIAFEKQHFKADLDEEAEKN